MPKISVIIPAYNEERVIDDCLESLVHQTESDYEVILIDDCSTDSTRSRIQSYVERYPEKFFLKEYGKVGPGRARNFASRDARGSFLAFMDADCIATPHWLENLMQGFTNSQVGSTGGPHRAPPQSSFFQLKVEHFFEAAAPFVSFFKSKNIQEICETDHNPLCNVAYRTEIFQRVGGFREDIFPGEDVAIDYMVRDLGFKITYNPKALVFHHRPETIDDFRKVMHAYGRSQGKLVREFGIRRRLQWVMLGFLNAALVFLFLLALAGFWTELLIALAFFAMMWNWRPKSERDFSLFFNACQWMNGFVEGFTKNRSDPPGPRPVSS